MLIDDPSFTDWYVDKYCIWCEWYDDINSFQPGCMSCKNGIPLNLEVFENGREREERKQV